MTRNKARQLVLDIVLCGDIDDGVQLLLAAQSPVAGDKETIRRLVQSLKDAQQELSAALIQRDNFQREMLRMVRERTGRLPIHLRHGTDDESENAQAAREVASLSHDDDPQPGAFYGLPSPEPAPELTPHG